jgi:hypothetical protein
MGAIVGAWRRPLAGLQFAGAAGRARWVAEGAETRTMASRRFTPLLAALPLVLLSPLLAAQDLIADMSAGPPTGRYAFASSTPRSLPDLLKGPGQGEPAQPVGHWFLPAGPERGPA